MAKSNAIAKSLKPVARTHGGAVATGQTAEQHLRRTVLSCLLWEDNFYEDGVAIADRIKELVRQVPASVVADLAYETRTQQHLRHAPLFLMSELAKTSTIDSEDLARVIQRADEMGEFLSIFTKDRPGTKKLNLIPNQVKRGLVKALRKFNAYQLAKYDRRNDAIKLRDVIRVTHPKPDNTEQAALWRGVLNGTLATPDTWEVALTEGGGANKRETWMRLLEQNKLGPLALIRNLRNMDLAGVPELNVRRALLSSRPDRVLPFRFIAAAKHAPRYKPELERLMLANLGDVEKLPGHTVLIVDVSGSMYGPKVSAKSDMNRAEAAAALAVLVNEVCESVAVYATAGNDSTRIHKTQLVEGYNGFALSDHVLGLSYPLGGGGIFLSQVMDYVSVRSPTTDRVIVITDEQDCDLTNNPANAKLFAPRNYMLNVSGYQNGVSHDRWTKIDGWSESVVDYIRAIERL